MPKMPIIVERAFSTIDFISNRLLQNIEANRNILRLNDYHNGGLPLKGTEFLKFRRFRHFSALEAFQSSPKIRFPGKYKCILLGEKANQ